MKILHVINSMTMGGAEILLTNSLSPGGLSEHAENHIAFFKFPTYLLDRLDKKVRVHFLDYKGIFDIVRLVNDIKIIIEKYKIDIVHSHLNPASLYSEFACHKNIIHLHTMHNTYSTDLERRPVLSLLERYLFFKRKHIKLIFLSEFTKNDFLSAIKFEGESFVLNNFIEESYFSLPQKRQCCTPEKKLKLIAVGNFRKQKNYFYLLEIFKKLADPHIQLDIYGAGNKEPLQQIIDKNRLNVQLKEPEKNISAVLEGYDLFIMPSTNEGFPLAVFEAMAAGLPLLLSDIKPLKSIVKDNARYFPLNDAAMVANLIKDISAKKINLTEMAIKAKQYAIKTVKKDIYIKRLVNIYMQSMK